MTQDRKEKLGLPTITLHWIVGLGILFMLGLGMYMTQAEDFAAFELHETIGILLFIVILARVVHRLRQGWPEPVSTYKRHEQLLSKAVHWLLIICTVLIPLSGIVMTAAGGFGLDVLGVNLVPANPDPANPYEMIAYVPFLAGMGYFVHGLTANLLMLGIVLHIAGALKHTLIDRDGTLKRMLGRRVSF